MRVNRELVVFKTGLPVVSLLDTEIRKLRFDGWGWARFVL